eukprot:9478622-Pyramimonas_sp.AAC.1
MRSTGCRAVRPKRCALGDAPLSGETLEDVRVVRRLGIDLPSGAVDDAPNLSLDLERGNGAVEVANATLQSSSKPSLDISPSE